MIFRNLILIFALTTQQKVICQDIIGFVAQNAINVNTDFKLDSVVYDHIRPFRLIMVGETHGTMEPALFVQELASLIIAEEGVVSVGLEIPEKDLNEFLKLPTDSALLESKFFSDENIDGRNGVAWFNLILHCVKDSNISLFCFDNFKSYKIADRDSAMYLSVKRELLRFPNSKVITLSGNVHNRLLPYKGFETLGSLIVDDSNLISHQRICSIQHTFCRGTALNNTGDGLRMHTYNYTDCIYSNAVDFTNFLLFYNSNTPSEYNTLLFTKEVSYSSKVQEHQ